MKKLFTFFAVALFTLLLTSSCSSSYTFYQVYKVSPANNIKKTRTDNGGIVYSDANCEIGYSFWSLNGDVSFVFENKTDSVIYIDLKSTFFINNGFCRYFQNLASNTFDIVAIAPGSYRVFKCEYPIKTTEYLSCNVRRYTDSPDSISFNYDNSPAIFSNYISYQIGKVGNTNVVENQFYISQMKNVPLPYMFDYVEIQKFACPDNVSYEPKRYNRVVKIPTNQHFYIIYEKFSKKALYKTKGLYDYHNMGEYYIKNK